MIQQYLQAFFQTHADDRFVGRYAAACLHTMRLTKVSARKYPPSTIEIAAVKNLNPLICRFYFLDGKAKAMGVDPSATASDVIRALAVLSSLPVLSQWERDKRSSMVMTKYTTVSHKPSYTTALGGGDSKFVFRKRVFRRPKEIPEDPVEYHLTYAQAVNSVVKVHGCSPISGYHGNTVGW